MPHLEPISDEKATSAVAPVFEKIKSKMGSVLNIFRTMGHAPEVLTSTLAFNESFHVGLDPKLRELAYLKTTFMNDCRY